MTWASPDLVRLLALAAGLTFELMLIASLNIAVALAGIGSARHHPLRGAIGGGAVFVLLMTFLVLGGPLTTLGGYARCIDPASLHCSLAGKDRHEAAHDPDPARNR